MKKIFMIAAMVMFMQPAVSNAQNFVVGVEDVDYYPLYSSEGGYKGIAKEILDKFAKEKGYTFEYKPYPITRLTKSFVEGEMDFKFPDNKYWAKDLKAGKGIKYSAAVLNYIDGVMIKKENVGKDVSSIKTLGTVRGFTAWEFLGLEKEGKVEIKGSSSLGSLVKQLANDRIDGMYFNVDVANYYLSNKTDQAGNIVFNDGLPHTKSFYHLSTIKHSNVLEELNSFLQSNQDWINKKKSEYKIK